MTRGANELTIRPDLTGVSNEERQRLIDLAGASDPASRTERHALMAKHPLMAESLGDVSRVVESALIQTWTADVAGAPEALAEGMAFKCDALRREHGYDNSSELERLMIDRLVACWLHVQYVEHRRTVQWSGSASFETRAFYDNAASRANADFLRASVALARVRRLLRPSVAQINIAASGGQQVNQVVGS